MGSKGLLKSSTQNLVEEDKITEFMSTPLHICFSKQNHAHILQGNSDKNVRSNIDPIQNI